MFIDNQCFCFCQHDDNYSILIKYYNFVVDLLAGDPECTALYWKLKYLMEIKHKKQYVF